MKKNYIRPAMTNEVIEATNMMAGSLPNGKDYTGGSTSGEANSRRGMWGDLWGDDASTEK
jgi:hypothetical protein